MQPDCDVVIVGGGAGGLSAALVLGRSLRHVVVVDAGEPRNRFAEHSHGLLGHDGLAPEDLLARGRNEVADCGAELVEASVVHLDVSDAGVVATTNTGTRFTARAAVVATGISDELPDIPGLSERWGVGVLHCPYCHGWEVRGQRLGVLAATPGSIHQVELVRRWSDRVTFFSAGLGTLEPETERRLRARGHPRGCRTRGRGHRRGSPDRRGPAGRRRRGRAGRHLYRGPAPSPRRVPRTSQPGAR